jgi:hypothetical protein
MANGLGTQGVGGESCRRSAEVRERRIVRRIAIAFARVGRAHRGPDVPVLGFCALDSVLPYHVARATMLVALLVAVAAADLGIHVLEDPSSCELRANKGDTVTVSYSGSIAESSTTGTPGAVFDSSSSFSFTLGVGSVIKGWDAGVECLCKGARVVLLIPPDMGYGARGAGGVIPGGATLSFTIQLLAISKCSGGACPSGLVPCPPRVLPATAAPTVVDAAPVDMITRSPETDSMSTGIGMRMHYTAGPSTKECAPWPQGLSLEDVQPTSSGWGQHYGIEGSPDSPPANVTVVQLYYSD